jgi:osmotically-inducible protein OsmY/sporulation protein YlmC with PRC-barrel domain
MKESRLELKIGARVETTDGPFGHIRQVILDPSQGRVTGLVVRAGLVPPREWLVPTELISDATDERVALRISSAEIEKQPVFDPSRFLSMEAEAQGYQEGEALVSVENVEGGSQEHPQSTILAVHKVALRSGQAVWGTDGRVGRVDLLLIDFQGQVRHFVIRKGGLLSHDVIVPVDWISRIDKRGVWLMTERAALEGLPSYRPDAALAEDVDQALWMDEVLRAIDYDAIDIHIHDGVVTLRGFASTLMIKKRAERAAHAVPGVLEVDNRIMTDEEITIAVSQALGRDERTRHLRILVSAKHGVVTLNGELDSAEERSVAEEVSASVPQVRGVVNYIRAPGVIVEADEQRVLQPRVGQDVYAEDMFLGHVERVILSPQNRLVTAIVVRGEFPDLERAKPGMLPYEVPREERQVLLPIESVRFVTISGVLLTVEALDAARYPDFEPDNFLAPAPDWQPPYPYEPSDILLDSDRAMAERVLESHTVSRKEE